jgi:hypothetical protein
MEERWRSGEPLEERWAECSTNLPGSGPRFSPRAGVNMIKLSVTDLKKHGAWGLTI